MSKLKHPVPKKYHKLLHINEADKRGNIIDFKIPPIIIYSDKSIKEHRKYVIDNHIDIRNLAMIYTDVKPFIILRPTAIIYKMFLKEKLKDHRFNIIEEIELDNFLLLSDILYKFDKNISFNWQWRIITRVMHETNTQNQNNAFIFLLEPDSYIDNFLMRLCNFKRNIRNDIGDVPIIIKYKNKKRLSLGIHHLHSPDPDRLLLEYNAIMHAKNKTSFFAQDSVY